MLTIGKDKLHHYLMVAMYYETFADYHADSGEFDERLTEAEWEGLLAADLDEIVADQGMSENQLGGDDILSIIKDALESRDKGYAIAIWYGPNSEALAVGYRTDELTLTDPLPTLPEADADISDRRIALIDNLRTDGKSEQDVAWQVASFDQANPTKGSDKEDDDTVGYDQDGGPVTHHSTGHPACPAVHDGTCPILGHNAEDHDELTGTLEDLAKGDE